MPVVKPQPGDLEAIEKASRDEISALQLQRLQATLQHVYDKVPHYRNAFDAKGVHPSDLKQLSDLSKFPFTVKKDLRDNYPFGFFAVPRENVARIHASSGTTGKPTVVGYTLKDIDTWSNVVARSIRAGGAKPGDMVHVSYGYGLFTGGMGAHYGAEKLGLTVVPFGGGQTERQVQLIQDFRPEIIMILASGETSLPRNRAAAASSFSRDLRASIRSAARSGMFSMSRPLGVTRSGSRPRKLLASEAVISLTVVKQSASRAEAVSMEHLAVMLWALASRCGEMCSMVE